MNNFSKIQERHIAANKYRFECQNVTDMKCECGQPASEHRYGTAECLGCDNCKKFKREMKNVVELDNARKMRCSCGGTIEKVQGEDDRYECDECGALFERDDWSRGGPDNPDKLKAVQNADPATCKSCKHGMDEHNADGDCMNCGKTCGPRGLNNATAKLECPVCHALRESEGALAAHLRAIHGYDHSYAAEIVKQVTERQNAGPMTQSERRRMLANQFKNEEVSKGQKEAEDAASWIRARKWKSEHDAIQAAIDEGDFSSTAATKAAGMVARSNPKAFENAYAYIYVGDKVKLKSEPDTTWTVTDFAGDTYVLRGPKGSRQARLDQLERVSL